MIELAHTHRTHQIRSDYELLALELMRLGRPKTSIDEMEAQYRGGIEFEKSVRLVSDWLFKLYPHFKARQHVCKGQGCS